MRPYLGSQTSARGAKDNAVHNGSKRREARSHNFTLSGPGWRNEPFPVGRPESTFRLANAHLSGRRLDHSPLPHIASRQRFCTRLGPAQDQAKGFGSSKLWEVNSLIDSRAPGNFCRPSHADSGTIPGPEFLDDHIEAQC